MELTIVPKDKVVVTEREAEMVKMLTEGHRPVEIASKLNVSNRTVETYLATLRRKTNCRTLPQLVAVFIKNGLID